MWWDRYQVTAGFCVAFVASHVDAMDPESIIVWTVPIAGMVLLSPTIIISTKLG